MLDWGDIEFLSLGETATYAARECSWVRSDGRDDDGIGLLLIELTKNNGDREEFRYVVKELDPLPGLVGRRFQLFKTPDAEPYTVVTGGMPSCSCMAGQTRARQENVCKHQDAMKAVEEKGLLRSKE